MLHYRGDDKSLARPGRKQATGTKLTFASHSKKKKNSEGCPSNQVSAAAMTSTLEEKGKLSILFFSQVGLRTYQHPCIVFHHVLHLTTYQNLNPCTNGYNQRERCMLHIQHFGKDDVQKNLQER